MASRVLAPLMGFLTEAVVLAWVWLFDSIQVNEVSQHQKDQVRTVIEGVRSRMDHSLNACLHVVLGLAAFAKADPGFDGAAFRTFAVELGGQIPG